MKTELVTSHEYGDEYKNIEIYYLIFFWRIFISTKHPTPMGLQRTVGVQT